jgi:arylsulfatase A-like enzyme
MASLHENRRATQTSTPRNILLITTDEQRFDSVGCMGNQYIRTPKIDALARRGTLFTHSFVQVPICIPSRTCLSTGRYAHQHGVMHMESVIRKSPALPPSEKMVSELLQERGYYTAAFGKIHVPARGFSQLALTGGKGARWTQAEGLPIGPAPLGQTYARWLEARSPGAYAKIYEQRQQPEYKKYHTAIVNCLPLEHYVDYWIAQNTIEFLRLPPAHPFFVWCGFCGPHGPLDPPEPYARMYPPEDAPLPATLQDSMEAKPAFHRKRGGLRNQDPNILRRVVAFYAALCTLLDAQVGRIMDVLTEQGLWENTLVVYTSDHGEMLGDFGMFGKAIFYEPVMRVPLIVAHPRAASNGRALDGLVEQIDLAPTFMEYAGLPPLPQMEGASLLPILRGESGGKPAVLCEYVSNDQRQRGKCVRTERYKYVFWGNAEMEEFYDLAEDPSERRNLVSNPRYQPEVEHHRRLLLEILTNSKGRSIPDFLSCDKDDAV